MNNVSNIVTEQRKQRVDEEKLTTNYIAETVSHLKTLYNYIKTESTTRSKPLRIS